MSTVKWKGGFDYKLCTRSAVWEQRVLGNEITAAVHLPFTAMQNVTQHKSPPKAAWAKRAANRASSRLSVSNRGSCQRGKPQRQAWHQIPRWDTEKGPLSQLHLCFSFFPSSTDIRGAETLSPTVGWWKNFLCSENKEWANLGRLSAHWFKNRFSYNMCQS